MMAGASLLLLAGTMQATEAAAATAPPVVSFGLSASSIDAGTPATGSGIVTRMPAGATVRLQQWLSGGWGNVGAATTPVRGRYSVRSQAQRLGLMAFRTVAVKGGKVLAKSPTRQLRAYGWIPLASSQMSSYDGGDWSTTDFTVKGMLLPASLMDRNVDNPFDDASFGRPDVAYFKSNGRCRAVRFTAGASDRPTPGWTEAPTDGVTLSVLVPGKLPVEAALEPGQTRPVTASLASASTWGLQALGQAQSSNDNWSKSSDAVFGSPQVSCYSQNW